MTVDNEIAVQNLTKLANHKGLTARSEKKADQEYMVWIDVTEEFVKNNTGSDSGIKETEEAMDCIPDGRKKNTVGNSYSLVQTLMPSKQQPVLALPVTVR